MSRWNQLLHPQRLGKPATGPVLRSARPLRTEFFKDWDRIVFCSAFRRLQDKTQVQPLAPTDYVRTRLTHSLEVASVGRSLGMLAGEALLQADADLEGVVTPQDVGAIVAAACLMHDIGNPPFGHAGEEAIAAYFAGPGQQWLDGLTEAQQQDFLRFEGNAQGLRTVVRLQHPEQRGGLQLTWPTLGAFAKYPRGSVASSTIGQGISGKKFCFMQSEATLFAEVADGLGLVRKSEGESAAWFRHPLAFLVEAADDICYSVIDIEDGVCSGHIGVAEALELHRPFLEPEVVARALEISAPLHRIEYLRAVTIGVLVDRAAAAFAERQAALLTGEFDHPISDLIDPDGHFAAFRRLAQERLYTEKSKSVLQLAGYEIIGQLLHLCCEALETVATGGQKSGRMRAEMVRRIMGRSQPLPVADTRYERLLQVTDFVAGMTDREAVDLHRRLKGQVL